MKNPYHKSFPRWLTAVVMDWLTIVAAYAVMAYFWNPVVAVLGVYFIGTRQHALFIMLHDTSHSLGSRYPWLNDWSGRVLCFAPLGIDLENYRTFHLQHHRALRHGGPDPEQDVKKIGGGRRWRVPLTGGMIVRNFLMDLVGLGAPFSYGMAFQMRSTTATGLITWGLWWAAALSLIGWYGAWWILWVWMIAFGTSFWAVFALRMTTEHVGTDDTQHITPRLWERWMVPHATWAHDLHHKNASIPCHRLPIELTKHGDLGGRQSILSLFSQLSKASAAHQEHAQT